MIDHKQKVYTKRCGFCGSTYETHRHHAKWCSARCRQGAYRRRLLSMWIINNQRDPDRPVEADDPDRTGRGHAPDIQAPADPIGQGGSKLLPQKNDDWPSWAGRRPDEYSPTRDRHS